MMTPQRIQLSRAKGWRKPENTIVVARPTRWGNPYAPEMAFGPGHAVGFRAPDGEIHWSGLTSYAGWRRLHQTSAHVLALADCVALFADYAKTLDVTALRGHNLACWCPLDRPCHAGVLLVLANEWGLT